MMRISGMPARWRIADMGRHVAPWIGSMYAYATEGAPANVPWMRAGRMSLCSGTPDGSSIPLLVKLESPSISGPSPLRNRGRTAFDALQRTRVTGLPAPRIRHHGQAAVTSPAGRPPRRPGAAQRARFSRRSLSASQDDPRPRTVDRSTGGFFPRAEHFAEAASGRGNLPALATSARALTCSSASGSGGRESRLGFATSRSRLSMDLPTNSWSKKAKRPSFRFG